MVKTLVVLMSVEFLDVIQIYPVLTDVGLEDIIGGIKMDDDNDLWRVEQEMNIDLAVLCGASRDVHTEEYGIWNDGAVRKIGC